MPAERNEPAALPPSGGDWICARASEQLPLDEPDRADEDTLNRILWHALRGDERAYPAELAAHTGRASAG